MPDLKGTPIVSNHEPVSRFEAAQERKRTGFSGVQVIMPGQDSESLAREAAAFQHADCITQPFYRIISINVRHRHDFGFDIQGRELDRQPCRFVLYAQRLRGYFPRFQCGKTGFGEDTLRSQPVKKK